MGTSFSEVGVMSTYFFLSFMKTASHFKQFIASVNMIIPLRDLGATGD